MAGAPAVYITKITMRDIWQAQNVLALPWNADEGMIMMSTVADAVYKKCDSMDGLVDGLIDDPRKCTFDALADLPACEDGVTPCFTAAQRTAIFEHKGRRVAFEGSDTVSVNLASEQNTGSDETVKGDFVV